MAQGAIDVFFGVIISVIDNRTGGEETISSPKKKKKKYITSLLTLGFLFSLLLLPPFPPPGGGIVFVSMLSEPEPHRKFESGAAVKTDLGVRGAGGRRRGKGEFLCVACIKGSMFKH